MAFLGFETKDTGFQTLVLKRGDNIVDTRVTALEIKGFPTVNIEKDLIVKGNLSINGSLVGNLPIDELVVNSITPKVPKDGITIKLKFNEEEKKITFDTYENQ